MAKGKVRRRGFGAFVGGLLLGALAVGLGAAAYLRFGSPPVATADRPFPFEGAMVSVPLKTRIADQLKTAPFGTSEDVYEGGARVYRAQCAACHGTPGHDTAFAAHMYPAAPQLWKRHVRDGVVGVSDDAPGETYWKVAHGIRLSGMPAFDHILTETQMWQVSLLLKNADQELPDPVVRLLTVPSDRLATLE